MNSKKQNHPYEHCSFITILLALAACGGTSGYEGDDTEGAQIAEPDGSGADDDADDGDDDGDDGAANGDCDSIRDAAWAILEANCASCHKPDGAGAAVFSDVNDLETHIEKGRIVPGSADDSRIIQVIEDGSMPPGDATVGADDVATLREWIDGCMPAAPCVDPDPIAFDDVLLYMRDDIVATDGNDRPFIRYFTLTHLNNVGICDADLEPFRYGLAKALNSLSSRVSVTAPVPIDPAKTIYRIDLRDYNWDASLWDDIIVARSPYAVVYQQDRARDIQEQTGTAVPFLLGDWFATDATAAPLYYEIMDRVLGFQADSLDELAQRLDGIDIRDNLNQEDRVIRASFASSGVSVSNRVIERHEFNTSSNRSLWVSYDFATNVDENRKNVLKRPLGPSPMFFPDGSLVSEEVTFDPDGHGAVFSLPNGLQAYMVFDAARQRIDRAPVEVMTDPKALDAVVVAGRSCMSCHKNGINEKADEAVPFNAANPELLDAAEREKLEALNQDFAILQALKQEDAGRYVSALVAAGIPEGLDIEPIFAVFETFAGKESAIDLRRAAAELGLTEDQLLGNLGLIGLGHLATGGTVTRDSFQNDFARNVCRLNLGIANDPECF